MMPLAISIGGETSIWLRLAELIIPPAGGVVAALGAVWLANGSSERRSRAERLSERALAALSLAEHLEDFVIHCAQVTTSHRTTNWASPWDVADYEEPPAWLDELPPWPDLVDWRLVGFDLAVEASNFRRKVTFAQEYLRQASDFLDNQDSHELNAEEAASLGEKAWALSVKVRTKAGLAPLEWPEHWSPLESLSRTLVDLVKKREEAKSDPTPTDF